MRQYRSGSLLILRPGTESSSKHNKLAKVVTIVIDDKQSLAQNRLTVTVCDRATNRSRGCRQVPASSLDRL